MQNELVKPARNPDLICIFPVFLAVAGFCNFILYERTAFQWPAADMFPFFSRMQDGTFLPGDYFTNASVAPNVRWVFGYFILGLGKIFNTDWYSTVFLVKSTLVVAMPVLYYLAIYFLVKRYVAENLLPLCQILITASILLVMTNYFNLLFSIAWWPPYSIDTTSSTVSLLWGLLAIIVHESWHTKWYVGILFFFLSTLFHPALGVFCISFYFLSIGYFIKTDYRKLIIIGLTGLLLPVLIIAVCFGSKWPLNAQEFISIYILNNHSFHYHLEDFASSYPFFNWRITLALIIMLLTIPLLFQAYRKNKKLLILTGLLSIFYILSIVAQYIFIDVLPIKAVAVIGPVRFSQFGYWILVLIWVTSFSPVLAKIPAFAKLGLHTLGFGRHEHLMRKLSLLLIPVLIVAGFAIKDDPFSEKYYANRPLYDFIKSTPPLSVFAVYKSEHTVNIPLVAKRAIFTGNGFPFNEDNMREFNSRNSLIFGDYKFYSTNDQLWIDQKINNFYRHLKPADFMHVARKYKLDYVIIEPAFSASFKSFRPVYKGKSAVIYKVTDFIN